MHVNCPCQLGELTRLICHGGTRVSLMPKQPAVEMLSPFITARAREQ